MDSKTSSFGIRIQRLVLQKLAIIFLLIIICSSVYKGKPIRPIYRDNKLLIMNEPNQAVNPEISRILDNILRLVNIS